MTIAHMQQRKYFRSRIPQANYPTVTPATLIGAGALAFEDLLLKDENIAKFDVRTQDNAGFSTGSDFATDQWPDRHDASVQHDLQVASDPIGRELYSALGSVVSTQPNSVGAPTAWQHAFSPQDPTTSRQLPAHTYGEKIGSAHSVKYPSCITEMISFSGDGTDRINASVGYRGSGKRTSPSGIVYSLDPATNHVEILTGLKYFFNSQISIVRSDYSTLANPVNYGTAKMLESWSFQWTNQLLLDDGYRPGSTDFQTAGDPESGAVRSELLFGTRTAEFSAVVRLDSATDEFAALQSQKRMDVQCLLTGPTIAGAVKHKLLISMPRVSYDMVEISNKNKIATVQLKFKILFDETTGKILEITLTNTTASYTV